jgi:PTS system sucrose-specific IIC component
VIKPDAMSAGIRGMKMLDIFLRKSVMGVVLSGLITGITKAVIQAGWLPKESQIALILTVIGSGN